MDLLFNRYANPFLLIDNLIATNKLFKFIIDLIDIVNDENIYDLWIHKVFDKSFNDFKNEIINNEVEVEDIETTVKDSYNILNNFKPN